MNYTTYWSILDSPSHRIKSNSIALALAIISVVLWYLIKKFKEDTADGDKKILLWSAGLFAIFGLIMFILMTYIYKDNSDAQTLNMLNSPTTSKIEGVVSNFQRTYRNARYSRVTIESFTVDSVHFVYEDAVLGKFNSFSKTNNNVIYNGNRVRVTYKLGSPYGKKINSILRIEI